MSTLAVTGATGVVGGRVARSLAARGIPLRLVVRDPARAPRLRGARAVRCSYGDRPAAVAALRGVTTLFMVSASESATRREEHATFVDAAAEAGVGHVVYLSFYGASPTATFTLARDHFAAEEHLRASGMAWTFLRDNIYAEYMRVYAGEEGVIRGPAGHGRVAAVSQADVADAAVTVLADPLRHRTRTYNLTGPVAFTLAEAAATLSEVLGGSYAFVDETVPEAYESRASYGAPQWQLDAWVSTYTAIAAGELAGVSGDVELLTGHPATSLADALRPGR
jgi:uncharacterized protein YbjT (DUF2867 family)